MRAQLLRHVQPCGTPWTAARQAPLSVGFSSKSTGVPCPLPGDLPDPGIQPASLVSSALADEFFTTSAIWEASFKLYLVVDSVLCFQVGDTGRDSSPTGDPRSSHLESEASSHVTLVPSTGPGVGVGARTQAPRRSDSGLWLLTWDPGTGGQDRSPPEARTRKSPLPRSRGSVAEESTPAISQGGRRVISLALNLLLNVAWWRCLTEPGRGDRPGACVRKSN